MAVEVDLLIGAVVGRCYRILKKHSVGGMGTIYAGEHEELGKPVAIKVLHPRVCEKPEAIERFMREARTASAVGHPNVVDVFDIGRCDDGRPFMVMPLLEGMDCERVLANRGPRSPATVCAWLAGAAAGLDALHRRGLVHRDVKPANLFLVRRDDGSETSMIMDFGLAAFQREGTRLTAKGIVLGTPHYLPPECATGTKADVPGDVYSLAVVAYEMISGALPFDHKDPSFVLAAKISNTAPLLSTHVSCSEELDEVFRRALSRRANLRPESCSALIEAIRAASGGEAQEGSAVVPAATATAPASTRQRDIRTERMRAELAERSTDSAKTNHPTRDSVQLPTRRRGLVVTAGVLALLLGGSLWVAAPQDASESASSGDPDASRDVPTPARLAGLDLPTLPSVPSSPSPIPSYEIADPSMSAVRTRPRIERIESDDSRIRREEHIPTVPEQDRARAERLTREANRLSLRGLLPAAIERYREATLVSPAHAPAWRGLGIANQRMNRNAEARRAFERYLRVAPGAADAARIEARLASL